MLYERDYRTLTQQEVELSEKVKEKYTKKLKGGGLLFTDLNNYHKKMPPAYFYYESLFPNNYLNIIDLEAKEHLKKLKRDFELILNQDATEREILNFIKDKKAFAFIGSLLKTYFCFGHHAAFLFNEFPLPPNYKVDYLLIGQNSDGYHFVFVELENSVGNISTKEGDFGVTLRKGLKQVQDWDSWLEANFSTLRLVFEKSLGTQKELPRELTVPDKTRFHYIVIGGRRKDFSNRIRLSKRKLKKDSNILLLHYDNLLDCIDTIIMSSNY